MKCIALAFLLLRGAIASYTLEEATAFVGAQHWWESGWYSDTGLEKHYDGYFCLCQCAATAEGVFCRGGGVHTDLTKPPVATFLGSFSKEDSAKGHWTGTLVAFNTSTPFVDTFRLKTPGGVANYTGARASASSRSFIWRGYMSGVKCEHRSFCRGFCKEQPAAPQGAANIEAWDMKCNHSYAPKTDIHNSTSLEISTILL